MWGNFKDKDDPHTYYIIFCIIALKILASINPMFPPNAFVKVLFLRISERKNNIMPEYLNYMQE